MTRLRSHAVALSQSLIPIKTRATISEDQTVKLRSLYPLLPCWGWLIGLWLTAATHAATSTSIAVAHNLQQEAQTALRDQAVLIVFFTRQGCSYCQTVRKQHLLPRLLLGQPKVHIVEIDQDSRAALLDFAGQHTTQEAFAHASGVKAVPVVAFFDAQGVPAARPIVGALLEDFYSAYLEAAIRQSACQQHIDAVTC